MKKFHHIAAVFVSAAIASCASGPPTESPEPDEAPRGKLEVVQEETEERYQPPEDKHLTEAQVEMYVRVKEREVELSSAAGPEASSADGRPLDIQAAAELDYSTSEYEWVEKMVGDAEMVTLGKLADTAAYQRYPQLAAQASQAQAEHVQFNAKLLEKYSDKLAQIKDGLRKTSTTQ